MRPVLPQPGASRAAPDAGAASGHGVLKTLGGLVSLPRHKSIPAVPERVVVSLYVVE